MSQIVPAPAESENASASPRVYNDAMEHEMNDMPPPARLNVLHFIIAIIVVAAVFSLGAWSQNHAPQPPLTGPYQSSGTAPEAAQSNIVVHVAGAVKKPGVYTLAQDARIQDAVQKAGGALPYGDPNQLNLAAWAEDGSRIEVPFKTKLAARPEPLDVPLVTTAKPPAEITSEKPEATKAPAKTATTARNSKPAPAHKINLNKATLEELSLLPAVGPATAAKIIEHRKTNGAFSSVDDLDEIKGIGEKKIEKIRPYATVR